MTCLHSQPRALAGPGLSAVREAAMPTRTVTDIEAELRRSTIAIRLAPGRYDARRIVELRKRQDELIDEWTKLARRCG